MFQRLEKSIIKMFKDKFKVETTIIDTKDKLSLKTEAHFDGEVVYEYEQPLEPLLEAFKKRL